MDGGKVNEVAALSDLAISPSSPIPLHLQLSGRLRKQIADGRLAPGDPLPTVRLLAKHCGMSQATVMRAISELAAEGLIVTRHGARSVVAERQVASTEVLIGNLRDAPTARDISFFQQLMDGLREGYREPNRRFLTTYLDANPIHGTELLKVCQVSHADGIAAFRPQGTAIAALQEAAQQMPVVTLLYPVPGAVTDHIGCDVASVLRELLEERLARGQRRFCYIGALPYFLKEPASPYAHIYHTLVETVRAAGAEFLEILLPEDGGRSREWPELGRKIPDGSVLVAGHPRLAMLCEGERPRLDLISYTEYRGSAELAADRVTTMYLGLETVGRTAAELLQTRLRSGNSLPSRTMWLRPTILKPGTVI